MKPLETEIVSETALTTREAMPVDVAKPQPSIADMLSAVVQAGVTADNVHVLDKLVAVYERTQDRDAEKAFAKAFIELQRELPTIPGTRGVPDKQGNIKFVYANFDDIDAIVRPICLKHGFSYSFRESAMAEGKVTMVMTLTHEAGHSRETPYTVRIGSGPPGTSESQNDVGGHTYAKRGALESGLSLRVIGEKPDPRNEGTPITAEQADAIEKRVALLNQDHGRFLKWLGVAKYSELTSKKYQQADEFLTKKENGQ
jgi:hypothetical protein